MVGHPILELRDIVKHFGLCKALDGVSFDLNAGEVHTICGENGSGKSTLIKVLSGAHAPDSGEIRISGNSLSCLTPQEALRFGVATIYQENMLFRNLPVFENIFIGRERRNASGLVDKASMIARAQEILESLGAEIDAKAEVGTLGGAEQKIVEIAKAVGCNARVMVMDEPTSSFGKHEVDLLFAVMRRLRAAGTGIIFISHHLEEVHEISDRVTVIRDGRNITCTAARDITNAQLIHDMVGHDVSQVFRHDSRTEDEAVLEVENLSGAGVHQASIRLQRGEIVGVAGLVGAGRSELLGTIFGNLPRTAGSVRLFGKKTNIKSPKDAINCGLCLITEDRKIDGLFLGQSCADNIQVPLLTKLGNLLVVGRETKTLARKFVNRLSIKITNIAQAVGSLSGGNQQKIILAKWMATNPEIYLLDEPTRGIDVGAKEEVYLEMQKLIEAGKSILMVSSELPEIAGLCDRVYVMKSGRVVNEIVGSHINEHNILASAL